LSGPIPEFVQKLRSQVGSVLLMLPAVTGVVVGGGGSGGRVLLGRRSDTGCWALIGGIMEPGEDVAEAVVREVFEETSVRVHPERITGVYTHADIVHINGDRSRYIVTAFCCTVVSGELRANDDESPDVTWFPLDGLPPLGPTQLEHWTTRCAPTPPRPSAVLPTDLHPGP
jgi:8-oxo-dGTP pyrophosphatase MutT (NUDIX family)